MRIGTFIAIVAGIMIPLQGITVGYVVSVEHRITRLETRLETRDGAIPVPRAGNQQTKGKGTSDEKVSGS